MQQVDRWQRLFYQVLLFGGLLALFLWLIIRLKVVTAPVIIGFFIAFALRPVVLWLRRLRVPPVLALTLPLLALVAMGVLLLVVILPNLAAELLDFSQKLPGRIGRVVVQLDPWWQQTFAVKLSSLVEPAVLRANLQSLIRELLGPATSVLGWVLVSTRDLLLAIGWVMLVFVVAAFLIDDYDRLVSQARTMVPLHQRARVDRIAGQIDDTLKGFIRGEILLFAVASLWFSSGLLVIDVGFAALVGPLVALIYLVPYVGVLVAALLALIVALLEVPTWGTFGGVLLIFGAFYAIDIVFITPRIIGGRVGLRPLVVLLGIIAGGQLLGVMGVLLAIPFLAVGRIVLLEFVARYRASEVFLGQPERDPDPGNEDAAKVPTSGHEDTGDPA